MIFIFLNLIFKNTALKTKWYTNCFINFSLFTTFTTTFAQMRFAIFFWFLNRLYVHRVYQYRMCRWYLCLQRSKWFASPTSTVGLGWFLDLLHWFSRVRLLDHVVLPCSNQIRSTFACTWFRHFYQKMDPSIKYRD